MERITHLKKQSSHDNCDCECNEEHAEEQGFTQCGCGESHSHSEQDPKHYEHIRNHHSQDHRSSQCTGGDHIQELHESHAHKHHTHDHCNCGHHDENEHVEMHHEHEHSQCSCEGHAHGNHDHHDHDSHEHCDCGCPEHSTVSTTMVKYRLSGLDCVDCAAKLESAVARQDGVVNATINFGAGLLYIEYQPELSDLKALLKLISGMGYGILHNTGDQRKSTFVVEGVDCPECAKKVGIAVSRLEGVDRAEYIFNLSILKVEHSCPSDKIVQTVQRLGYSAHLRDTAGQPSEPTTTRWWKNKKVLFTAASGILWVIGLVIQLAYHNSQIALPFLVGALVFGGYFPAKAGFVALKSSFALDMNVLLVIAVVGALAMKEYVEAATVVFLFSLGTTLEYYAMDKTRASIRSLMELAPKVATVVRDGKEQVVSTTDLRIGDRIIAKPGERLPIDGVVVAGHSSVNQAPITGESMPVSKKTADEVYAGTINGEGSLDIRVTRLVGDTTLAKIITMVEEAQAQKAPSQRFVDVFAKYYTPAVIVLALGIAFVPPLILGHGFREWIYRALPLLVVSCPCALVISTPVSIVSAIGNAARNGILIKGGAYLEQAGRLGVVAFDKTGTLTEGNPVVTDIVAGKESDEEEVLRLAASVESRSEHPLAQAICKESEQRKLTLHRAEHFVSITGKGVKAKLDGINYYVGKPAFAENDLRLQLNQLQDSINELQSQGKTVMVVARKSDVYGIVAVADRVREESKQAIRKLRETGIEKIVMLTGDNEITAAAIAREIGVDEFAAELLPQDKMNYIQTLQSKGQYVAMVGDGINDAPALAAATIGIAMGTAGTDTALETADIALMADDLSKLPYAISLSRRALGIIKQNIGFSLVVKLAAISLVFPGWLNLWIAIMADTGAALVVILNGMRLLKQR